MKLSLMLEGQNGLNWERLGRIAPLVESLGFNGLYRSDHFTNTAPPNLDSLELWVSLTWLAATTTRLDFGPLVAPVSFRDPIMMARQAAAIADLSGGRLRLGLGAGWQDREHEMFGYDLLDVPGRFARFTEALEITSKLLRSPEPVTFEGRFYHLKEAELLPRPQAALPIVIGGNGPQRTLPLVARYADEWNGVYIPPARFQELSSHLDNLASDAGRDPATIRRTLMTGLLWGGDQAAVVGKLNGRDANEIRERGVVAGTSAEVIEQLGALAAAGVAEVMLQWLDLDDIEGLTTFGTEVVGQFKG